MESKKIILKGERNAILTLRGENSNVRWELQPNVKIGAVALFDRQGRMYSAEDRLLQMNLEDICAAAILENGRILAKGDTDGDFPWVRLQAEIMMKQKITGKSKETASVPKEPIRQNIIEQQVETTARQEQGPVVDTKSWEQEIEPVTRAYDAAEQQANEAAEWTELEDKANEVIEYATEPENQEEPAGEFLEKTQEPTDVFESGFEDKQISFQADNPIEIEADEREESTPFFAGQTDPNFVASVANDSHEQTWEERSIEESQSPAKHCPMEPIVTRVPAAVLGEGSLFQR